MDTYQQRAEHIAELERRNREALRRTLEAAAHIDAQMRAVNLAVQLWVDAATAPMRAFADVIRLMR